MNLQQLRYLVSVADTGSVTGAAQAQRVTQPVVSRALRDLERQLGLTLLRQSGRRLGLTDAGLAVLDAARRAVQAFEEVERTARRLALGAELTVVTTPTNSVLLTPVVTAFIQRHPEVALHLRRAVSMAEVFEMVAGGEAELGFGDLPDPPSNPSTQTEALWEAEIVLVSPLGTELPPAVRLGDLSKTTLVLPPGGSERRRNIEEVFAAEGIRPPPSALATDERSAWITAAQQGLGSFLSYRTAAADLDGVEVRSFNPVKRAGVGFALRSESLSEHGREVLRLAQRLTPPPGCRPAKAARHRTRESHPADSRKEPPTTQRRKNK
jgi:DNA-binding transcriptional LysR family regulator